MKQGIGIYKQAKLKYSEKPPYFPCAIFPEYPFADKRLDKSNQAYGSLRQLLLLLGLDAENFNKKSWNPFGSFVFPGNTVLLKPNFMRHFNERGGIEGLITHGSVIRAVADYVYIALKGKGRIIIADGPMDDADFEKIADLRGIWEIQRFYKENTGFEIEVYDLRREKVKKRGERIVHREELKGDPLGYSVVDLGDISAFKKNVLDYRTFRGAECKTEIMSLHHNETKDEYLIANTLLCADVVINLPKMKTHKRAGVTLSLKNMVGITGDRNWLPHSSECGSENKCCCNASLKTKVSKLLKNAINLIRPVRDALRQFVGVTEATKTSGNWYGNDIMWRTILDLGYINRYADRKGVMTNLVQRRNFIIVDGIVAGEGDGPTNPAPKPCGVLVGGFNELCVDIATSRVMGFDPMKIPKFKNISNEAFQKFCGMDLKDTKCASNIKEWNKNIVDFRGKCLDFKPHYGWKGHIESED